jgi:hypothetical protein
MKTRESKDPRRLAEEFVDLSIQLGNCGIFSANLEEDVPRSKRVEEIFAFLSQGTTYAKEVRA